jgi:hypothetical protein
LLVRGSKRSPNTRDSKLKQFPSQKQNKRANRNVSQCSHNVFIHVFFLNHTLDGLLFTSTCTFERVYGPCVFFVVLKKKPSISLFSPPPFSFSFSTKGFWGFQPSIMSELDSFIDATKGVEDDFVPFEDMEIVEEMERIVEEIISRVIEEGKTMKGESEIDILMETQTDKPEGDADMNVMVSFLPFYASVVIVVIFSTKVYVRLYGRVLV